MCVCVCVASRDIVRTIAVLCMRERESICVCFACSFVVRLCLLCRCVWSSFVCVCVVWTVVCVYEQDYCELANMPIEELQSRVANHDLPDHFTQVPPPPPLPP